MLTNLNRKLDDTASTLIQAEAKHVGDEMLHNNLLLIRVRALDDSLNKEVAEHVTAHGQEHGAILDHLTEDLVVQSSVRLDRILLLKEAASVLVSSKLEQRLVGHNVFECNSRRDDSLSINSPGRKGAFQRSTSAGTVLDLKQKQGWDAYLNVFEKPASEDAKVSSTFRSTRRRRTFSRLSRERRGVEKGVEVRHPVD